MKWFWIALLIATSAAFGQNASIPSSPEDIEYPVALWSPPTLKGHRHVLPNGIILFAIPQTSAERISMDIGFFAEDAPSPDFGNLLGRYLALAGPRSLPPGELQKRILAMGGVLDFRPVRGIPALHLSFPPEALPSILPLLTSALRKPRWDAALLQSCKAAQAQLKANKRLGFCAPELNAFLQKAGILSLGLKNQSLQTATVKELEAIHRDFFHPRRIMIAAAGPFDSEILIDHLNKTIDTLPLGLARPPIPASTYTGKPAVFIARGSSGEACGFAGYVSEPVNDIDLDVVLLVTFSILADRLINRVRNAEYVVPYLEPHINVDARGHGYLGFSFRLPTDIAAKVIAWLLEEQAGLAQAGPSREEVWIAQEKLQRFRRIDNAGAANQARYLTFMECARGLPVSEAFLREGFIGIGTDQVQKSAASQFKAKRLTTVISGDIDKIEKEIRSWGLEKRFPIVRFEIEGR